MHPHAVAQPYALIDLKAEDYIQPHFTEGLSGLKLTNM